MAGCGSVADLVTHLCTALIPGVFFAPRQAVWLALGAVVPDAAARVPGLALDLLRRVGIGIPPGVESPLAVFHMPIGIVLGTLVIAPLLHPEQRTRAVRWLIAGGFLHLAVDLLQDHHGHGYFLFFPLSVRRWELGWVGSEASTLWAPWLVGVTVLLWGMRWWAHRRASGRATSPPER